MYIEPTVGVIIPPPELRNIVDKTAGFVARNGPEFESRIQNNEQNNPKFNFLRAGDPYNAYYQQKVKQICEESTTSTENGGPAKIPSESIDGSTNGASATLAVKDARVESRVPDKVKQFIEKVSIPLEAPPEPQFVAEPPTSCALELQVLRLTARYVAVHGRSLLTHLMQKEQRNPLFDFLRPTHNGFSYLTRMIEQYSKVLQPDEMTLHSLKQDIEPQKFWQRLQRNVEWAKIQEAQQKKDAEAAERERLQYAQIDWHDFVIVETVDYQPGESGLFPPPTTPEQVGARIAAQQRIEAIENDGKEPTSRKDDDMDEDDDDELNGLDNDSAQADSDRQTMPPPAALPPLPSSLDKVLIRKDYDPKAARRTNGTSNVVVADSSKKDNWVISPITNERIPTEKMAEHMRYALLDPRWVEERERAVAEKMQQEEVFAPGVAIESSLKQLAERRTDIFGSGDAETEIGKKIDEESDVSRSREKVTWDGYTSSAEATRKAARANITIEEQIQQIHRMKGLVDDDGKDRIGPAVPPSLTSSSALSMDVNSIVSSSSSIISSGPTMSNRMQPMHPMQSMDNIMHHRPPHMQPPTFSGIHGTPHPYPQPASHLGHPPQAHPPPPPFMIPPNPMLSMFPMPGAPPPMPPMGPPGGPLNFNVAAPPPPPTMSNPNEMLTMNADDEPAAKRMRSEDNLIPEDEFLATHSGSVTLQIQCPNQPDKSDLRLHGQRLAVTLNLTDMVSALKSAIHQQTNLVASKQKLQLDGIFIKDNNTLAFYNVTDGCSVSLALKERGGRKK